MLVPRIFTSLVCASVLATAAVTTLALTSSTALALERHAGYYYPIPATSETYKARAETFEDSNRKRRIFFITELTTE